jgi:hypothetical protein
MIIAFGLRQTKRGKQKSHKLLPGVNSPGIFLPGIEPEQLFVFTYPERPESPGPVKLHRVNLFKILVDLVVDSCYIGVSKKENAMFLTIENNHTGELLCNRRLGPYEKLDIEALVSKEIDRLYCGELELEYSDNVPNGCAEYYAQIRTRKHDSLCVWTTGDFFYKRETE